MFPNLDQICSHNKDTEVSKFPPRYTVQFLFVRIWNLLFFSFIFETRLNWPSPGAFRGPMEGIPLPPSHLRRCTLGWLICLTVTGTTFTL